MNSPPSQTLASIERIEASPRADVCPISLILRATQAPGGGGFTKHRRKWKPARFASFEEFRPIDGDAAERQRRVIGVADQAVAKIEVAAITIIGGLNHDEMPECVRGEFTPRQRHIGNDVSVDNEERMHTQKPQRFVYPAAGLENVIALLTVDDFKTIAPAGPYALDDLPAEPAQVYHHMRDATVTESCQVALEQALSPDFDEAFGERVGQGTQAFAAPRRQQHGDHGSPTRRGNTRSSMR